MCNSKVKNCDDLGFTTVAQIHGRSVLQPTCNRVVGIDPYRALKKPLSFPSTKPQPAPTAKNIEGVAAVTRKSSTPPPSPKVKHIKRSSNEPNSLNSSSEKPLSPKSTTAAKAAAAPLVRRKSKNSTSNQASVLLTTPAIDLAPLNYKAIASLFDDKAPGSLAAAQREQASLMQVQRKMRIAHYGRAVKKLERKVTPIVEAQNENSGSQEEKRCSFITANSDPVYVAYHDEEWGVPVHDDKMLFELLVLSGAQVGLDWTSILKKRDDFRAAFAGFDVEVVSKLTEKQMTFISEEYGIDMGRVRDIVDNSHRILEIRKAFGSLDKYLWGFVNNKPISMQYRSCRKIPVKTSKSESISKDMVRRGFRFVGPTIIHSFMQAAGLTNDHLVTCPRHHQCATGTH